MPEFAGAVGEMTRRASRRKLGHDRDPTPVGDVLDTLMRALGAPSAPAIHALFEEWETIAGPVLAPVAKPVKLDPEELVVVVEDPAWASQVRWHETDLRRRCGEVCGVTPARTTVRVNPHLRSDT